MISKFITATLFAIALIFISIDYTNAQDVKPNTNPVQPTFENCTFKIKNNTTYLAVQQSASITNLKTLSIVTNVYADRKLIFSEISRSTFAATNGFSGAYYFEYEPLINSNNRNIRIRNTIYYTGPDKVARVTVCNINLQLW